MLIAKQNWLTLFSVVIIVTGIKAQEGIVATGIDAQSNSGSTSYTIGQVTYNIQTGTNGSIIQGLQQPYEISDISGIKQVNGISLSCFAFPNPTTNFLILKIGNELFSQLVASLYDTDGKLLQSFNITDTETKINMFSLVSGCYFLKITKLEESIMTFKIIKNSNL